LPVIGANSVCLVLSATILVLKWRFDRSHPDQTQRSSQADAAPS
jgi:hypothetical protein